MQIKYLICILFLGISMFSHAQHKSEIIGKIINERTGSPIVGITVSLQENKISTVTNEEGIFKFSNLLAGRETLLIQSAGYRNFEMQLTIEAGEKLEVNTIALIAENQYEIQAGIGIIDDSELSIEGENGNQDIQTSVILSNDIYLNKVGYKLSPYRYRIRGYDPFYEQTYINGVLANDQYRRVFNYSSIGAMNDLTRNGDVLNYNQSGSFSFGNIGGSENINLRASSFAKGGKATVSYTNRNYYGRGILSYSSGLLDNGWAFTGLVGARYSDEGYIPGTSYQNFSYALSVEKQWQDGNHALSLVSYGSPVVRGQQGSSFQEAYDLTGDNLYNPNWGYYKGKVRNSRIVNAYDPTAILSHRWVLDEKTTLNSGALLHYGRYSNTALNWYNAMDPRPDYYRYLPSYFLNNSDSNEPVTYELYQNLWKSKDPKVTQLNWDEMYRQNRNLENIRKYNGAALYMLEERHSDLLEGTLTSTFRKMYDNNSTLTMGVEGRMTRSYQYKTVQDLLGAEFVMDLDKFAERENPGNHQIKQNDLIFPDRKVVQGDIFGYDYDIDIRHLNAWVANDYKTRNLDFYYGTKISYTDFQRKGNMKNGRFPNHSFGRGSLLSFIDYSIKAGANYKFDGRHFLSANISYATESPIPDRAYVMPRVTERTVNGLSSSKLFHSDINYVFSLPQIAGRISVFQTNFYDQLERMAYYHDSERTFVFHNLSNVDRIHRGIEAGITYTLNQQWNFDFIGNLGEYYYQNNPLGTINSENGKLVNVEEMVYLKNTYVSGTPQAIAIVAARYFYDYWFLEINSNWVGRNYLSTSALRRIASNYKQVNPFDESFAAYQKLTTQERLNNALTVDASIGKLLYLKNRKSMNFNLSIVNLLNRKDIKTGGFEQGRLDLKFPERFNSRYFYMQGINVFLNANYRF